ncbi:MAG: NAD-dependent epimerase/dehydratase family protein [Arcobacteraceae bacterium]
MKNILITGASGFIGKALSNKLTSIGFNVIQFNSSYGDIAHFNFVNEFSNIKINHIFHLAAKTFVPDSWINPLKFYETSVLGTGNVLEFCRYRKIPLTFISAYIYGEPEQLPISENCKLNANNPYAHSKLLAEEMCQFYSENFNIKIVIARPFNIYGKHQNEKFLIPYILKQVLQNEEIKVKDLHPKRDYLYLDDLVDGLIQTMNCNNNFSIFNFGSGYSLSVEDIIQKIQEVVGSNKKVIAENIQRKNEIMNVVADITKAQEELGWRPRISFQEGIKEIVAGISHE